MIIGIDANQGNKKLKSGVEWYAYHLIESLKEISQTDEYKDLEFRLYSSEPLQGEVSKLPPRWHEKVLPWVKLPFWNLWTQVRLSWEFIVNPPDVFVAPGYTLSLIHPKKSVVVIHDLGFEYFPEYYPTISRWYYRLVSWYSIKTAWRIIVPSEYTKQDIAKHYGYPLGKIFVTPLGFDKDLYKPISDQETINQVLEKYKLSKSYVLYIGRMTRKKNILGVIKSFHGLKQTGKYGELQLALGGQQQIGWAEAQEYIKQNNLDKDVRVLGYVDEIDKPVLMSAAEVFVFPSFFEGFGIPVLEAMAAGVAVVTSKTSSLGEVVADAALTVNPEKTDEITKAMDKILSDDALRERLSKAGMQRASQFSWEQTAKDTLAVLTKE